VVPIIEKLSIERALEGNSESAVAIRMQAKRSVKAIAERLKVNLCTILPVCEVQLQVISPSSSAITRRWERPLKPALVGRARLRRNRRRAKGYREAARQWAAPGADYFD
jgi:hypothetical protein